MTFESINFNFNYILNKIFLKIVSYFKEIKLTVFYLVLCKYQVETLTFREICEGSKSQSYNEQSDHFRLQVHLESQKYDTVLDLVQEYKYKFL